MKIPGIASSPFAFLRKKWGKHWAAAWYGRVSVECLFGNHIKTIEIINRMFEEDESLKEDGHLKLILGVSYYRLGNSEEALKTFALGTALTRRNPPTQTVLRQFAKWEMGIYAELLKLQSEESKAQEILGYIEESYGDVLPLGEYGLDKRKEIGKWRLFWKKTAG